MKKIIYDFGSNNGDDIPYYLLKADLVVAVEANPILSQLIVKRFKNEIDSGKLIVESCALTAKEENEKVVFYVHNEKHPKSQFPRPSDNEITNYSEIIVPSKSVNSILQKHGTPFYIKIDIEHYDHVILRALFENNYKPPFISAESHSIEIYSLLVTMGYGAFKLVNGNSVWNDYRECIIQGENSDVTYSFPKHSAGPFGNDVYGNWMNTENFARLLAFEGMGWKDIHASNFEKPDPTLIPSLNKYYFLALKRNVMYYVPVPIQRLVKRIYKAIIRRLQS